MNSGISAQKKESRNLGCFDCKNFLLLMRNEKSSKDWGGLSVDLSRLFKSDSLRLTVKLLKEVFILRGKCWDWVSCWTVLGFDGLPWMAGTEIELYNRRLGFG